MLFIHQKLKKTLLLFTVSLLTLSNASATTAIKDNKPIVPEILHGFWQFNEDKSGNWNGFYLGENFLEVFYNLSRVERIEYEDETYTFHLINTIYHSSTLKMKLNGSDSATLFYEDGSSKTCEKFNHDPNTEILPVSQYKKVISKNYFSKDDAHNSVSIHKNTLTWNGEKWDIIWLGEYLKKEFRALIQKENDYKLIYITHLSDTSLKIVHNQGVDYYQNISPALREDKLYGTWCDPISNEWIIGFFDKIAVYKNEAWQYNIVNQTKESYQIKLKNGDKKQVIQMKLKGKHLMNGELTIDNQKQELELMGKPRPYNYPDTKQFTDYDYIPDTVTINGYVQNYPDKERLFTVLINDFLYDNQTEYHADIDENGLFSLKFPVVNTCEVFIELFRLGITDVVEPGESYFLYINYAGPVWHMGDNARLHRELTAYSKVRKDPYDYYRENDLTEEQYIAQCRNIFERNRAKTKHFFSQNGVQSDRLKYYAEKRDISNLGLILMQGRFSLDRINKERFSPEYMQLADSIYHTLPKPVSLVSNSSKTFLIDYTSYYNRIFIDDANGFFTYFPGYIYALYYMDKEGLFSFTDRQRQAVKDVEVIQTEVFRASLMGNSEPDIEQTEETLESVGIYNSLLENETIKQFINQEWKDIGQEVKLNRELISVDSLPMSEKIREIMVLRNALRQFEGRQDTISSVLHGLYNARIKSPYIKSLIQQEQEKYIARHNDVIEYPASLKRTDHLKESKDADKLLKELTEPYLGKVILIDFWGIWCGPCKYQMQFMGPIKEQLKDKDVVFMYFANNSPEEGWKNTIKEYQLSGENVVHYNLPAEQQSMLERRLGVSSFPTYLIMDKTGNLVDMDAPDPSSGETLIKVLKDWSEK